jgi:hypothetical protein
MANERGRERIQKFLQSHFWQKLSFNTAFKTLRIERERE